VRLGSLFSGAGQLDCAVERVFGATAVWHSEVDPAASKVLAAHWPGVPNLGDITVVDWSGVEPVDILCGGYPCQPFSSAGQRKGATDERHLWPYFAEAIRRVRPRFVVLENVAGHRAMGFDQVLGDLAEIGFDAEWTSLRAADVGAPHSRERIFVLAYAAGEFGSPITQGDDATALDSAGTRASHRDRAGHSSARVSELGRGTWRQSCHDADADSGRFQVRAQLDRHEASDTADRDSQGRHADRCPGVDWGRYRDGIERWESLTRPSPAPKTDSGSLNPAFSEWLLGWPAGWVTDIPGAGRVAQLRIIGNGVVPQQAEAALRYLLSVACEVVA
jgi:DNA (cytosine-5)-methyltransferase 1